MKLYTIGPTEMYQNTKEIRKKEVPYFRTDEFSKDMMRMDELLKKFMGTAEDSKCIYLTASGTAAMEATVMNFFDEKDKVLVINGGSFGSRFVKICKTHNIPHDVIELEFEEELTERHFAPYASNKYSAVIVNLHETSTGQLYNIKMLREFADKTGALLVVDAISTFLCDEFHMDEWGIDAVIISSQKGLCVTPGMAVVALNQKILKTMKPAKTIYFDFKDYIDNMERGQTPFTPAVGIVYEMLDMLEAIEAEGLDARLEKIQRLADVYRETVVCDGIRLLNCPISNAVTTTIFDKPVATEIYNRLKKEGIYVNPSGGELGKYIFRVSHVGDLKEDETKQLAEVIKLLYKQYE